MPTILKRNINSHTVFAIWKMSEPLESLSQTDIQVPKDIRSNQRKKEWICSRLLLNEIAPKTNINYNAFGAPELSDKRAISISHSKDYCGILISKKKASLDIEIISEKANQLKKQFISKEEDTLVTNSETSTLIWCAKECLFKIHQKGNLIFKKDLIIHKIEENAISSSLKGDEYKLHFEKFENYFLVYYFE